MVNKNIKIYLTTLYIKGVQIKSKNSEKLKYHYIYIRILKYKNTDNIK